MVRRQEKRERKVKEKKDISKKIFVWTFQIVIVILFAYVLVYFFGQTRTNIGQSMENTIAGGDTVLLNELSYRLTRPSRGDVIAFRPRGSSNSHSYIKRVVGLPGETIQIKDGMLYINETVYLEKNDFPPMTDAGLAAEPITLGTSEYFVLGDSRNNSEDSRYADIGLVEAGDIEGKIWCIVSPREHFGLVK